MSTQNRPLWTGDFVKEMHLNSIKSSDVAEKLNVTREHVSRILNGKIVVKNAEQRFTEALEELIQERKK